MTQISTIRGFWNRIGRMIFFSLATFLLLSGNFFGQSRNIQLAMENSQRVDELMELEKFDEAEILLQKTFELSLPDTLQALIENQYSMVLGFQGEFEQAIAHSGTAIALYSKQFGEGNKHTIDAIYNKGELFGGLDNYDSLFYYLEKALDLYNQYTPDEHADIGLVHNNLAANYRSKGLNRKAIFHFKRAVESWEKVAEERPDYLIVGYENLGAYLETEESLSYLQKALDLKISEGANPFRSYIEIASKHVSFENYSESLRYYHIGIKLLKPLADKQKETGFDFQLDLSSTYGLVAQAHEGLKQYDSARYYYQLAYEVPTIRNSPTLQTRYLTAKANIYRFIGENDKAIRELLKVLPQTNRPNDYMFGYVTYSLSKVFAAQKDFKQALYYNMLSLRYDVSENKELEVDSLMKVFNRNELPLNSNSAVLLNNHALYMKNLADNEDGFNVEMLKIALQNVEQAVAHFEELVEGEYSSLFYKRAFDKAMETHQSILLNLYEATDEKHYLVQAFSVSERAKINKTLLYFNDQEIRSMAELPEDIFDRDRQLKSQIAEEERSIFRESQKEIKDSASLRASYNELFILRRDYEAFEAQIREKYPKYFELKHNVEPIGIAEIQSGLEEGSVAIAYSLHDTNLFIYTISKNDISAKQLEIAESLRLEIEAYRADLLNPSVAPENLAFSAHTLFKSLIAPALAQIELPNELLIIPDKEISTIPFETLVTRNEAGSGFSNLPYLLHQSEVHYAYSASLWHKQHTAKNEKASRLWAGFAPNYDNAFQSLNMSQISTSDEIISILPGAEQEVEELADLMDGTLFIGKEANKEALLQAGKDYKVLHLAMHSTVNNDQPMYSSFLFTPNLENDDEQLTVSELFHEELNAELVVLSACNTGYGRLLPGEGVLSLSQAFTAAGCPSTLMSLWMVPDQETRVLMGNFYEGIKAKKSKGESLHLAKINYLKEVDNDRMAHPFYWAGFVLSGNEKAVSQPINYRGLVAGLSMIVLIGGLFFWRMNRAA